MYHIQTSLEKPIYSILFLVLWLTVEAEGEGGEGKGEGERETERGKLPSGWLDLTPELGCGKQQPLGTTKTGRQIGWVL